MTENENENPKIEIGKIKNVKDNQKLKAKYRYENGLISTRFDRIEIGNRKNNFYFWREDIADTIVLSLDLINISEVMTDDNKIKAIILEEIAEKMEFEDIEVENKEKEKQIKTEIAELQNPDSLLKP